MDEKAEFAARLRDAMVAAGYEARPGVLEKGFNSHYWGRSVTFQAVSRWLRGEAIPSQEKLQALAEWLNVEPHVLRYGEHVAKRVRPNKSAGTKASAIRNAKSSRPSSNCRWRSARSCAR